MMRDYKFKRTEWTPRRKRRLSLRLFIRVLALLVAAGVGYAIFDYFATRTGQSSPRSATPSHIIPLQLPPNPTG
jgi:hypothetical protein